MKDLFYSQKDGFLFWVAGYTRDGSTSVVSEQIESLRANADLFAKTAGVPFDLVSTAFIEKSSRYKYMRVFYAEVKPECVPEMAFKLSENWPMCKWLQD